MGAQAERGQLSLHRKKRIWKLRASQFGPRKREEMTVEQAAQVMDSFLALGPGDIAVVSGVRPRVHLSSALRTEVIAAENEAVEVPIP